MTPDDSQRSRAWSENERPRYWWHRLPGNDYVPPIYSDLAESEWATLREWYEETDRSGPIGESVIGVATVPGSTVLQRIPWWA